MDFHSSARKLLVLSLLTATVIGFASVASATITINSAEIILMGDEEAAGARGNGMLSIGDTIEVVVDVTPADSVLTVVADMRKYGGGEAETLHTFQGSDAWASNPAWNPTCSDTGYAEMNGLGIYWPQAPVVQDESWTVCWVEPIMAAATAPVINNSCSGWMAQMLTPEIIDASAIVDENWSVRYSTSGAADSFIVVGSVTGQLPDLAPADSIIQYTHYAVTAGGDTLFSFVIDIASGSVSPCCAFWPADCDGFTWSTTAAVPGWWQVTGSVTGTLADSAFMDSLYYGVAGATDTLFTFTIENAADLCCETLCDSCDNFTFNTWAYIPPDNIYRDTLVVADGGTYWIDNTPCDYVSHTDPSALVTAWNVLWPDSLFPYDMDTLSTTVPEDDGGMPIDYDTHHTLYANISGSSGEFTEEGNYYFMFETLESGVYSLWGGEDEILNPATVMGYQPDTAYAYLYLANLSNLAGNDDIADFYFDAHWFGDMYSDTSLASVDAEGWWVEGNPFYGNIDCSINYNGVTGLWQVEFPIMEGTTDVEAGEQVMLKWVSDSGDTTYIPSFAHTLAAIDNMVPASKDPAASDSVTADDIHFAAEMGNAGNADVLNPASVDNPTPDWLQARIDLAGLYDLDDVRNGGWLFADMRFAGYDQAVGTPFGLNFLAEMDSLSPIYGTAEMDIVASPPSTYAWDQDIIETTVWIFDNAGNMWVPGTNDSAMSIDNILPYIDPSVCIADTVIWTEISVADAPYPGYANVGEPAGNMHGNNYNSRDVITLHADIGDALGVSEVEDVVLVGDPYCVGGLTLYDDGASGDDVVAGDKNYTGRSIVQIGDGVDYCFLDTDEEPAFFDVVVTDDAGNKAVNASCFGVRYDNELPTISAENVAVMFWDHPGTLPVDGDVNGDGIVSVGDSIIFEWRAEDETWDETEIDMVRVNSASIDPTYAGWIVLYWDPSGGVYRNYVPGEAGAPYAIAPGSIDGETLHAHFCVWDNAGNSTGWKDFVSDPPLTLDNVGGMIQWNLFQVSVTGPDGIAAIGDTISFYYDGPDNDVVAVWINVDDVSQTVEWLELVQGASWSGSIVVDAGMIHDMDYEFMGKAFDNVDNEDSGLLPGIPIDNMPPTMDCGNTWLRLWDYVDNASDRYVNIGDNLTAIYWDDDGDVASVTCDWSNYGLGTTDLVKGFQEQPELWGYRLDPVPENGVDQGPGGTGTMVHMVATDEAGNTAEGWFCPIWHNEAENDSTLHLSGGTCDHICQPVDTERPGPPDASAITFELIDDDGNGVANIGDRLRIIVDMGDPTALGYDMQWESAMVHADIHQYGADYEAEPDLYLMLNDDGFSAGGEGDGRFSYYFFFNNGDGDQLIEGAPILPGALDVAADDDATRIRVRSMDDAGNYSDGWVTSDVLMGDVGPVAVDNGMPEVDPEWITVTFIDEDMNGILSIGDTATVAVDMTDAPGNEVAGVWANLYDWGYPSMDMVALEANSPVYTLTWVIERVPGDWWIDERLFEDELPEEGQEPETSPPAFRAIQLEPEMEVVAADSSGNWSAYDWTGAPGWLVLAWGDPFIQEWPFMWTWTSSGPIYEFMADTDAPDPVNPTFTATDFGGSAVRATRLVDGRIGIDIFYDFEPRNPDVFEFYVFGDLAVPGQVDFNTYLGEPVPAANVPETGWGDDYEWVSDVLPERAEPYNFGILAKDNADNYSDPALTWIAGEDADATAPTGYVDVFNGQDAPAAIINDDGYFHGYINEPAEFQNVCYVEWYGRVKDLDPLTEGDQPSMWVFFAETGGYPPSYPLPTMPYQAGPEALLSAVAAAVPSFDYLQCTDFEVCIVPWDEAGNYPPLSACEPTAYTYDTFDPVVTWYSVGGYTDPWNQEFSNTETPEIQVAATEACGANAELTYEIWLTKIGGQDINMGGLLLDKQILPVGTNYTFDWSLANYPQGFASVELYLGDEAGNWTSHLWQVVVLDEWAPTGIFAVGDDPDNMIIDGQHLLGSEFSGFYFLVQWPNYMPNYDVEEVKAYWKMSGSPDDWTLIATDTGYGDSGPDEDGYYHYDYWFDFDTSIFQDGDALDLMVEVMDGRGNINTAYVTVVISSAYPVLTIDIPEAMDVCGAPTVAGTINIVGTEQSCPWDTYEAFWMYKRTDEPDLGDCDWDGRWVQPEPMFRTGVTDETIWRYTFDTTGMPDGSYDIMLCTYNGADVWSWDQDHDWCVDAGAFAAAVANGMGMTVVVDNTAPEVRIVDVNCAGNVYEGTAAYVSCGEDVTVTAWTATTCDVARVEYYLYGSEVLDDRQLVGSSSDWAGDYAVTFPASGDICDFLEPGALSDGYAMPDLVARVVDLLGNYMEYGIEFFILNVDPTSAFLTNPTPGFVRHWVALRADVIDADAVYSVTYQYQAVGAPDWTDIATTKVQMGVPWNLDAHNDTIFWRTELFADGDYYLRAVATNENMIVDDNPPQIMVTVDNTPPVLTLDMSPMYPEVPAGGTSFIGGPYVEIMADATDASGMRWLRFWYRPAETPLSGATLLFEDREAPYAYTWDEDSTVPFPGVISGGYLITGQGEDYAGNMVFVDQEIYIDHCPPWGWVSQINDDLTPNNSQFSGMLTIAGVCEDGATEAECSFANWQENSGMYGAQFQYAPVDGGRLMAAENTMALDWKDLGGLIVGDGPTYTLNWDASFATPGEYYIRLVGFDNVNNDAGSMGWSLPYIMIEILTPGPSTAQIAGYDNVSGWLVATAPTNVGYVRFEYQPGDIPVFGDETGWTLIDQTGTAMTPGVYGIPVNLDNVPAGTYHIRAVGVNGDGTEDANPPVMPVTVDEDGILHSVDPDAISAFERWGNIGNKDMITVGAIAPVQPTIVVLLDNDIPNAFNTPTAILLNPEVAGDPTYWVDNFDITGAGDHGNAVILASDVDDANVVGVFTENVRTYRTVEAEGTKGPVSQDGMTVDIPSGAYDYTDGVLLIHTPTPDAAPSIEDVVPVGPPVMFTSIDNGFDCFEEGYTAHVTMQYDEADIPAGGSESNLRVARWHESDRKWYISGIFGVSQDMDNNEISFSASCMDLYAVVHTVGFRVANPVFMPWCNNYTGPWPVFYSIIEDVVHGVSPEDIQVRIDGPEGNPIFDNMLIWDGGDPANGWNGTYDGVSNRLIMSIDEDCDWEDYYGSDCATYGLPGGDYTLHYVAINGVGERRTLDWSFTVDATPPEVELLGDVVGAHPVIELQVSDAHAGLDLWKICADMYIVERIDQDCCYDGYYGPVEAEERLGWIKPSSLRWQDDDPASGILLLEFGEVYFDGMSHGLSIDVVVYDCEHECRGGDSDCDDCLCYYMDHGMADCVGNHATPVWRRYTIDIYHDDDGDDDGCGINEVYFYPNPFDVSAGSPGTIYYSAECPGRVTIKIFDFAGDYVTTVYDGWSSGTDRVHWYGQDETGRVLGAGAYIGSITFDNGSAVMTRNFKIGVIK